MFSLKLLLTLLVLLGLANGWANADSDVRNDLYDGYDVSSTEANDKLQEVADSIYQAIRDGQAKRQVKRDVLGVIWDGIKFVFELFARKKRFSSVVDINKRVIDDELKRTIKPVTLHGWNFQPHMMYIRQPEEGKTCDPEVIAKGQKIKEALKIIDKVTTLAEVEEAKC